MNEKINTEKAPEPVGSYPHARRVGNLLFLSGVGPRKPGTKVIPGVMVDGQGNAVGHDIETQCYSVFENVKIIFFLEKMKKMKKCQIFRGVRGGSGPISKARI